MEGQLFPALCPRLSALSQHGGRAKALAGVMSDAGARWRAGEGRRGPSLGVEQVSAATCRWEGRALRGIS